MTVRYPVGAFSLLFQVDHDISIQVRAESERHELALESAVARGPLETPSAAQYDNLRLREECRRFFHFGRSSHFKPKNRTVAEAYVAISEIRADAVDIVIGRRVL